VLGKGPGHFGRNIVKKFADYQRLFAKAATNKHQAIGEACVGYLYFYQQTIPSIKKYLGNPKIIIILRNPVNRAYSDYLHHVRDGLENLTFAQALQKDRRNKNWWWGYQLKDIGLYYRQVKAYLDNFSQVEILLSNDLKKNKISLLDNLFRFLQVDPSFRPETSVKYNKTGIPKHPKLNKFVVNPNKLKNFIKPVATKVIPHSARQYLVDKIRYANLTKPPIKPIIKERLINFYRPEVNKLSELINRDLSSWFK